MPSPSTAELQAQLVREVGDPNGTITPILPTLWDVYGAQANVAPMLLYLYAKRAALDVRLAEEAQNTDFSLGQELSDKQGQRSQHLQQMRENTHAEIIRLESITRSSRVPRTGKMTTVEPVAPPSGLPDSNDPLYQGTPYERVHW